MIGAPWGGENQRGVVYVYYGQPSIHKPLLLKQKITPKHVTNGDKLQGFGFSFAEVCYVLYFMCVNCTFEVTQEILNKNQTEKWSKFT